MGRFKNDKGGRTSKLTHDFCDVLEDILSDDITKNLLSDEKKYFLVEQKWIELGKDKNDLPSFQSFKDYRRGSLPKKLTDAEIIDRFSTIVKKHLLKTEDALLRKLHEDQENKNWQRLAWLLERRFEEWNLRLKQENVNYEEKKKLPPWLDQK